VTPDALLGLAVPVALGLLSGVLGLFSQPEAALTALNRYALYIAFPALIASGLTAGAFQLPGQPWFWAVVPVGMALTVVPYAWTRDGGTLALTSLFGNVAYVGLPLCVAVLGESALGTASLAVSAFAMMSLLIGPVLLVRWSPEAEGRGVWKTVLRQPLLWAPVVGLGLRLVPEPVPSTFHDLAQPIGHSAGPVALFLLGLYIWTHRRGVIGEPLPLGLHVIGKLVWFPAVIGALVMAALALGWRDTTAARAMLLLACTPSAIATFSLAEELGLGQRRVAQTIVATTAVASVSLPVMAAWTLHFVR
jgi:predicted permease